MKMPTNSWSSTELCIHIIPNVFNNVECSFIWTFVFIPVTNLPKTARLLKLAVNYRAMVLCVFVFEFRSVPKLRTHQSLLFPFFFSLFCNVTFMK